MLVRTTGCSGVANLRSPPQARSKGVPPSLDAPQSTSLSCSLSLLTPRMCNSAAVSTCTYLVVAKNNIRPACSNFAVYSTYMLPRRLRQLDVLLGYHIPPMGGGGGGQSTRFNPRIKIWYEPHPSVLLGYHIPPMRGRGAEHQIQPPESKYGMNPTAHLPLSKHYHGTHHQTRT